MTDLAGQQLGGYQILSRLGAGGMGEVYRATDLKLGRDVALKVLAASLASDAGYLRRFEEEARSASVLNHPNIVTIYGAGEDGAVAFIAMELVQGRTFRELCSGDPRPLNYVLDVAVQLADGLAAAHASGIVHRDLKPENVMVTPDGLVLQLSRRGRARAGPEGTAAGRRRRAPARCDLAEAVGSGTLLLRHRRAGAGDPEQPKQRGRRGRVAGVPPPLAAPGDLLAPGEVNTPEREAQHDRLLRDNNWHVNGGVAYSLPRIDLFVSYVEDVKGTDAHAGRAFTAGVSWPFEISR